MRKVRICDITLRDGHQSRFATLMNTEQILRVVPLIAEAGYDSAEVWGGATLDVATRFLFEDPFERLEKIREATHGELTLTALCRGNNLFAYNHYPREFINEFMKESVSAGVDMMSIFDALNDENNIMHAVEGVKRAGGKIDGTVCYTTGPIFNVDYFVKIAKTYESLGIDRLRIKDMAGLLEPEECYKLVRALKKEIKVPIYLHTHTTPGFANLCHFIWLEGGGDGLDTVLLPFSGGPSHPPVELIDLGARMMGFDTGLSQDPHLFDTLRHQLDRIVDEIIAKWSQSQGFDIYKPVWLGKERIEKALDPILNLIPQKKWEEALNRMHQLEKEMGFPPPDVAAWKSQIPGGMYTNFIKELKKLNKMELLEQCLAEVQNVRAKTGYVPLVTPTSQVVGTRALQNVVFGPWVGISNEFVRLMLGGFGRTPVPIKEEDVEEIRQAMKVDKEKFNLQNYTFKIDMNIPNVDELATTPPTSLCATNRDRLLYLQLKSSAPFLKRKLMKNNIARVVELLALDKDKYVQTVVDAKNREIQELKRELHLLKRKEPGDIETINKILLNALT